MCLQWMRHMDAVGCPRQIRQGIRIVIIVVLIVACLAGRVFESDAWLRLSQQ